MPGFNLVRNARVFFTTNLDSSRRVNTTGFTADNTKELQVLNGFSYSQGTATEAITVEEGGEHVARSQRTFNTALDPVEFSFSAYLRPYLDSGDVTAEESVLWNALFSGENVDDTGVVLANISNFAQTGTSNKVALDFDSADFDTADIKVGSVITFQGFDDHQWDAPATITSISGTSSAVTGMTVEYARAPTTSAPVGTNVTIFKGAVVNQEENGVDYLLVHNADSNRNQLQAFGLIIITDQLTYLVDNAALNQATIDFGLADISTVQWSGNAVALNQTNTNVTASAGTFAGGVSGSYQQKQTDANFITNKLSTVKLESTFRGLGSGAKEYKIALTGGSLTIDNGIQYVTPELLGIVNTPIGYFTGTRAISGTINAYLKTGSLNTAELLSDMLAASTSETESKFAFNLGIGGHNNPTRVEIDMPATMLQIPAIEVQDVMSTSINFSAQAFDASEGSTAGGDAEYDLEKANEIFIRYYSA